MTSGIKPSTRFAVLAEAKFTCRYCGRSAPEVVLHVDHVVPRSNGGGNDRGNLVAACSDCNHGKSNAGLDGQPATRPNRGRSTPADSPLWTYRSLESNYEHTTELWLYAELDYSSVLGDVEPYPDNPFLWYCDQIRRRYPHEWEADATPICWTVEPAGEFAPFTPAAAEAEMDFLRYYTWPTRDGQRLNWYTDLRVRLDRFIGFERAIGWRPTPFQRTAPIRSLAERAKRRQPLLRRAV